MTTINTDALDKINEQLNGLINYMDAYTAEIQTEINNAGNKAQEVADEKMAELSSLMTQKLNTIRGQIVDTFSAQYQVALKKIEPIEPLLNVSISLDTVVSVVKSIINIITAPYQPIIDFTTQIIPKITELSANLQTIANYQPNIDVPGVNIPPLEIEIAPITPGDITG